MRAILLVAGLLGLLAAPIGAGAQSTQHTSTATSCSAGTYVNSRGNTVCRPVRANSAPSGATAKCRDGTYSFSQSHRGTCSHHGGVQDWL